jgi:hypothetical protein
MSGPRHAIDWDLFWLEHPDSLNGEPHISISEARGAAMFLGGYAKDAAELRGWLKMLGLLPYKASPRSNRPPDGCATTNVSYERPGHERGI